ncbi:diguanylate cyclase domain-containing protein, partial [Pseudomonas syringae group genomosp. 7]|uniref:diguanylate cyclase domain-containing protein n=1 Tax=Pseudomonas syringae group genomosp. 7 TaxID=251699 RepID=UPI00376F804B
QFIADLSWEAAHVPLTGLVNRSLFEHRLQRVLYGDDGRTGSLCLMFLDLYQLKLVNDTCGQAEGDELLRQICRALTQWLR